MKVHQFCAVRLQGLLFSNLCQDSPVEDSPLKE